MQQIPAPLGSGCNQNKSEGVFLEGVYLVTPVVAGRVAGWCLNPPSTENKFLSAPFPSVRPSFGFPNSPVSQTTTGPRGFAASSAAR